MRSLEEIGFNESLVSIDFITDLYVMGTTSIGTPLTHSVPSFLLFFLKSTRKIDQPLSIYVPEILNLPATMTNFLAASATSFSWN